MDTSDTASPPPSPSFSLPLDPGPSWNVPRISLPECMGLLKQYQTEWWYYVGHAIANDGEEFSFQFEFLRAALGGESLEWQVVAGPVGIGTRSTGEYLWAPGYGFGVSEQIQEQLGPGLAEPGQGSASLAVLPATDTQYGLNLVPWFGSSLSVLYTGGAPVATVGSTYVLRAQSWEFAETAFQVEVTFTDRRGLVMEGSSGYVGGGSYEFAQPRLEITGGILELDGTVYKLVGGWLWNDRQVITHPPQPAAGEVDRTRPDLALAAATSKPLYRGCWLALSLDNGACLAMAVFWQPPAAGCKQWVTGTRVGRPPIGGFGTVYLPVDGSFASRNGGQPLQGADPYGTHDFDLNILFPEQGEESPHWESTASGHTYATGWWIRFDPRLAALGVPENLYLRAVVDGCENLLPDIPPNTNAFWEGAAHVYADAAGRQPIGRAFVEQMGFD